MKARVWDEAVVPSLALRWRLSAETDAPALLGAQSNDVPANGNERLGPPCFPLFLLTSDHTRRPPDRRAARSSDRWSSFAIFRPPQCQASTTSRRKHTSSWGRSCSNPKVRKRVPRVRARPSGCGKACASKRRPPRPSLLSPHQPCGSDVTRPRPSIGCASRLHVEPSTRRTCRLRTSQFDPCGLHFVE